VDTIARRWLSNFLGDRPDRLQFDEKFTSRIDGWQSYFDKTVRCEPIEQLLCLTEGYSGMTTDSMHKRHWV